MPISANGRRRPCDQRRLAFGAALHHEIDADDAERETEPLPRRRPARRAAGWRASRSGSAAGSPPARRNPRAACGRSRRTRRRDSSHAPAGRSPRCAAIAGPRRPERPRRKDDRAEHQHDRAHPHGQKGHRFGIRQAKLGADEARGPQQHEHRGRRDCGGIGEIARLCFSAFPASAAVFSRIRFRRPVPCATLPCADAWFGQPGGLFRNRRCRAGWFTSTHCQGDRPCLNPVIAIRVSTRRRFGKTKRAPGAWASLNPPTPCGAGSPAPSSSRWCWSSCSRAARATAPARRRCRRRPRRPARPRPARALRLRHRPRRPRGQLAARPPARAARSLQPRSPANPPR